MIWVGVLLGSLLSSPEAVQGVAFVVIFPITFIASTFVPAETLPGVLRTIAEWNPVTSLAESLRILFGNPHQAAGAGDPWSMQHPARLHAAVCAAVIAVCAPLAVSRFQRVDHGLDGPPPPQERQHAPLVLRRALAQAVGVAHVGHVPVLGGPARGRGVLHVELVLGPALARDQQQRRVAARDLLDERRAAAGRR